MSPRSTSSALPSHRAINPSAELVDRLIDALVPDHAKGKQDRDWWNGRLRSIAYHEAGHAVVIALLFAPETIEFVTVDATLDTTETNMGFVRCSRMLRRVPRLLNLGPKDLGRDVSLLMKRTVLMANGTVAYAGVAAEFPSGLGDTHELGWILKQENPDDYVGSVNDVFADIWENCSGDRESFEVFAAEYGRPRPANRWHAPSWDRARRLVSAHWKAVDELAEALLLRGTLKGYEVVAITDQEETP